MEQDDLLFKWLNDELSDSELELFMQREDYARNLEILRAAMAFKAENHSSVSDFNTFRKNYKSKDKSGRVIKMPIWIRVAAAVIIGLGIFFTFFNTGNMEVSTLIAEKTVVMLPDNSEVQLNASSRIEYNSKTWDKQRSLNLNGEAFFKVAKGKTFTVNTPAGSITVLGTQFNVKQRTGYFEVKCFEGLVSVSVDTLQQQLKAGRSLRISDDQLVLSSTIDNNPPWIENFSRFNAVPLDQVLEELQRQYEVDLSLHDVNTKRLFTGIFTHEDLEKALIEITTPMDLTYELNGSILQIHGNQNR
ncbi:MAG: FecR family protein [Flavobacteriaceae bacterium]|nr:FecR family protein [Flavobacteriaceae bacterium]